MEHRRISGGKIQHLDEMDSLHNPRNESKNPKMANFGRLYHDQGITKKHIAYV